MLLPDSLLISISLVAEEEGRKTVDLSPSSTATAKPVVLRPPNKDLRRSATL